MSSTPISEGLEGVVAATSSISDVNGAEGRLLYRGYDIHDLAAHSTFEETTYLLWHAALPTRARLEAFDRSLAAARPLPPGVRDLLAGLPASAEPMAVLRTATSALALSDPDEADDTRGAALRKSVRLAAQVPAIVAAFDRGRRGLAPVEPDPALSHAANVLYMVRGERPDAATARALDVALILHADHELNASTFAARVTAATLSDLHSAITSAIGTLKGPLHGGANEDVMRLAIEIGAPDRAAEVVRELLARKAKIPGLGHRVYRTEDPRVRHLRRMSRELGERSGTPRWYEITRAIEQAVWAEKRLYPNVDLYSASVYRALGFPIDLFTPVFAISRISGWCAHVMEQQGDNRLIRPRAEYVGPRDLPYVPLDERG